MLDGKQKSLMQKHSNPEIKAKQVIVNVSLISNPAPNTTASRLATTIKG